MKICFYVIFEIRHNLVDIDNRVEYDCVGSADYAERERREIINESLEQPSFKVETALNCWYDFGLGRGGNIIDLATEMYQSTDLRYLMRCIADSCPVPSVQTVAECREIIYESLEHGTLC